MRIAPQWVSVHPLFNIYSIIKEAYEVTNQEANLFTANLENSRGMLYKKMRRFEEAERDYNRVLNTREQYLEDQHPEILSIKHNLCKSKIILTWLAELFYAKGDKDKAAEYAKEVLEAHQALQKNNFYSD